MSGADPAGVAGVTGAVEAAEVDGDVLAAPVAAALGVAAAGRCPCPSADRTPGMSRYAPIPPSTTTMPRNASTRWAGLRSMTARYFFLRTGRSQKGPGGLASAPGLAWLPPPWSDAAGPRPEGGAADGPVPSRQLPEPLPEPLSLARSGG